ncbi:hypothetical protein KQH60_05685 [Mycetohabitans sp. B8]|uniref:hypothetical protein n=1 Tax=Mycetohabitans sp. B8 TaxID=2841845 RepID=UPI001F2CD64A|nr:hypothetical protein [Mycetohabitans sp. B8]MCG1042075.1 hypothetical protein [Mycetohabitans sp. B8]
MATHPNITKRVYYELASDMDRIGVDYDATGRGEPSEWLDDELVRTADFYMCGPVPFMAPHKRALIDAGVVPERVHTEVFGSGTV